MLQIYREDALFGFYRGCMTNLLRTTPAAAVTFTSFEIINRRLREWAAGESAPAAAGAARRPAGQAAAAGGGAAGAPQQQLAAAGGTGRQGAGPAEHDPRRLEAHLRGQLGEGHGGTG